MLGVGAYAEVRACRDRQTGQECAVKMIMKRRDAHGQAGLSGGQGGLSGGQAGLSGGQGGLSGGQGGLGAGSEGARWDDAPHIPGVFSDNDDDRAKSRVFKEVALFQLCQGHPNVLQLLDFYPEPNRYSHSFSFPILFSYFYNLVSCV